MMESWRRRRRGEREGCIAGDSLMVMGAGLGAWGLGLRWEDEMVDGEIMTRSGSNG